MIRTLLSSIDLFFQSRSQNVILLFCLFLSLGIGALDYKGTAGVLIVYLVPIAIGAWYGSQKVGMVIAVYCALAWFFQVTYISTAGSSLGVSGVLNATQWLSFLARLVTFGVLVQVISRLRSAMRLQREMTQFIVHDLRSPISSAITGLLTLKETTSELDPIDREMVELSLVSNQRALELVNSMLDLSKLEAGSMIINPQRLVTEEFLHSCIEIVELWAKGSNISIVPESSVPAILLDPDLTRRVLVNLLSNAIKFSHEHGSILVRVFAGDSNLHISVSDAGQGIPPEYVNSIFEPFSQVKGTKGGTGLGLTFCRLAVNAQGGKIWAESKLGQGTTFQITFPKAIPS